MTESLSNQYPRLKWEPHADSTSLPCYMAHPHGEGQGWARVQRYLPAPPFARWQWLVLWPNRFRHDGACETKQAAADAATIAYWDAMEETEGWAPPPPPPPPAPVDEVALAYWRGLDEWLYGGRATMDAVKQLMDRYRSAAINGPSIIDKETDHQVWMRLTDAFSRRLLKRERY